ncbi:MAG: glycoside hydrolase family 2 TIM barrel-domain containing protein [Acidimicrobiales bacterium]
MRRRVGVNPLDAFGPRSWTRPEITSFGRLPMSASLARSCSQSLDGLWSFRLRDRPEAVTEADVSGPTDTWTQVAVPGCWTMQGFDRPQYTNTTMSFDGPPPRVPIDNPTGIYRRRLTVPDAWAGQRIVLQVGGAESVLYVHAGGRPVGMGKDSRLPQEFDVSAHLEPGRPVDLALTVVRWSEATYLEDQDHWYHAGLHRSVLLYATPPVYLRDLHVSTDYDGATDRGHARVKVATDAPSYGPKGWSVQVELAGLVSEAPARFEHPTNTAVNLAVFEGRGAVFDLTFPGVRPWSAESPVLYDLTAKLLDAGGEVVDSVTTAIGFRRVEVQGHELLVNGRAVLIKGVNRHDHDPRDGKAVTRASIDVDVALMKQHNLNAIRTSHYPNDSHLYDVCDRLGMYVVDEANVESHAYLRSLSKTTVWAGAILDRVVRMAERDKNHPSVIMWSLGNESGVSPAHAAAAEWLRAFDSGRPVQYESGISEDELAALVAGERPDAAEIFARPRRESDVIAPMYPSVASIVEWAKRAVPDRPLIMCEYCHAMGNSCGGLDAYWGAIRTYPGLQGGFLWDWVDQALVQRLSDGSERLAYGGDFGDMPHDGAFCLNGLVSAERTPHPSLVEAAKVLQPVRLLPIDPARGIVEIVNEHAFVDLSWLQASWDVAVDGRSSASGELELPEITAGTSAVVRIPVPAVSPPPGGRADLTVTLRTRADLPWVAAGHVVAWEQLLMAAAAGRSQAPQRPRGRGDELTSPGAFEPQLALWRAPIDNETFGPRHAERWARLGLPASSSSATIMTSGRADRLEAVVEHRIVIPDELDDIARVGVRLHLGAGIQAVEWLGFGPHECYSDRRASARFGRFALGVDDWPVPYVHPQASGNRLGVRWLCFLDESGEPVLVVDELDDLDVTVARVTDEEVAAAGHLEDLVLRDDCYLWLDARHRGVGSGACGPDVSPEHRVAPGTYCVRYRLR